MPYSYKKENGKYVVYKKDSGKKVGSTDGTKEALKKYLAALHMNEGLLQEGPHDQGIFKAVFTSGAPGAGKGYVSSELFGMDKNIARRMSTYGLKVINIDDVFEYLVKKNGYSLQDLESIPKDKDEYFRKKSRTVTARLMKQSLQSRLGLVIDGTGAQPGLLANQKKLLEKYGYDTLLVFVDTPLEVALANNRKRERRLKDEVVKMSWEKAQKNKEKLLTIFPNHIIVVNDGKSPIDTKAHKAAQAFVSAPIKNPTAKRWLAHFNVK